MGFRYGDRLTAREVRAGIFSICFLRRESAVVENIHEGTVSDCTKLRMPICLETHPWSVACRSSSVTHIEESLIPAWRF